MGYAAPDKQSHTQRWATPWSFFSGVNRRFGFDLDVCAEEWSAKCDRYFTKETDGLAQPWWPNATWWCNPPYSNIEPWFERGLTAAMEHDCPGVYLVPVSSSTEWFHTYAIRGHIGLVKGRLAHDPPPDIASELPNKHELGGCNFDSMLVVYEPQVLRGDVERRLFRVDRTGRELEPTPTMTQRTLF